MWSKILVILMILMGVGILLLSLYSASLAGLERQMGIVSGDVRQSIDSNEFYRGLMEVGGVPDCSWWQTTAAIPRYIFTEPNKKIELGYQLGRERRDCAITYILKGNVERGIYTLLKSLRYDHVRLIEIEREVDQDKENCAANRVKNEYGQVEAYLDATSGSARGVIEREYRDIQRLQARLAELCE